MLALAAATAAAGIATAAAAAPSGAASTDPPANDAFAPGAGQQSGGEIVLRTAPPPAALAAGMRRWRRHTHQRLAPVVREWRELNRAARGHPGPPLVAGCRRLDLALAAVGREGLPVAPDASVSLHLEQTLRALAAAAASCSEGAWFLTSWRLRQAETAWRELRGRLLLYDLRP